MNSIINLSFWCSLGKCPSQVHITPFTFSAVTTGQLPLLLLVYKKIYLLLFKQ